MLISYYIVTQIKRVTTFLKIRSWTTTVHLQKFFWQRKTIGHQQVLLVSHLTYCLQLPVLYLRRLSRPKYHKFSLKLLIFPMLQYQDFNCKAVTKLFYLPIIQLMDYNGTIARLTADNKVVYQWVRREIRLASDNSWARHCLKHVSWRLRWIIFLCTLYTWTENGSFMRNLTSWPMPFWLVLLIEHNVLHCYATNAVYCCLVSGQLYQSCGFC